MLEGQKQESRLKPAGSTERLGYCERGWSVAVTVVIVAASEAVRDRSEAGDEEVAGSICSMSSSRSSTSMITGDALSAGRFELSDPAERIVIGRDDPKNESMLG